MNKPVDADWKLIKFAGGFNPYADKDSFDWRQPRAIDKRKKDALNRARRRTIKRLAHA